MSAFIFSNPGLQSRFDDAIVFDNYSTEELVEILVRLAAERDYDLTPEAIDKAAALIDDWPRHPGFGNAREVRNLFHTLTRKQAALLADDVTSTTDLRTITAEAVPDLRPATPPSEPQHPGYL
jgi:Holliday junction resolvasome RuvABC ATP-dependent DNA helicase subunit